MKKMINALLLSVVLFSCKKENSLPVTKPETSVTKKLVKTTEVYDKGKPYFEEYSYDAQGRTSVIQNLDIKRIFDYVSSTFLIVTDRGAVDGVVVQTRECDINNKGLITKIVIKNTLGKVTYTYDFMYNADGYMTGRKGTYPTGSIDEMKFVIKDGNVVSYKLYHDNVLSNTVEYTFSSKINKSPFSYAGYWNVPKLFGKPTKNLYSEVKEFNTAEILTWHTKSSFDLDTDGYPSKLTLNNLLDGKTTVETYLYQP